MPYKPPAPCTVPACGALVTGGGRCPKCRADARRESDSRRGDAPARGYGPGHYRRFRPQVLRRDLVCRCDLMVCDHGGQPCRRRSTVADHWPLSRRELVARGMDPDDPRHGRGLCPRCDKRQTARRQPGGFNQNQRPR